MRAAIVMLLSLSLLCGLLYPLAATVGARLIAPERAAGSLLRRSGEVVGSEWIGQEFHDPGYLWSRPSATKTPYAPCQPDLSAGSGGSNLGPLHPELRAVVAERLSALRAAAAAVGAPVDGPVPVDLVTASASGLDPHLSLAAAAFQVPRIARARGVDEAEVRAVLATATHGRQFGLLGQPVVHVLRANLALDAAFGPPPR